jgi:hypothetical protein
VQYLSGFAAVRSACEGSNGVADFAPLEEPEAAGGRRGRGGREGADTEAEKAARAETYGGSGRVEESGGDDGGREAKHQEEAGSDLGEDRQREEEGARRFLDSARRMNE